MSGLAEDTASLAESITLNHQDTKTQKKSFFVLCLRVLVVNFSGMGSLAEGGAKGEPGKTSSGIRGGEDV